MPSRAKLRWWPAVLLPSGRTGSRSERRILGNPGCRWLRRLCNLTVSMKRERSANGTYIRQDEDNGQDPDGSGLVRRKIETYLQQIDEESQHGPRSRHPLDAPCDDDKQNRIHEAPPIEAQHRSVIDDAES